MTRTTTRVRLYIQVLAGALGALLLLALLRADWPAGRRRPDAVAALPVRAVWLYLDSAAARSEAPPALSTAALERRRQQGIPIFDGDRPLPPHLVRQIRRTGARVRVESPWLRAVSVDATEPQLRALGRLPFVRRITPVGKLAAAGGPRLPAGGELFRTARSWLAAPPAPPLFALELDSAHYGVNYRAILALGIPQVHDLGLSGAGVGIAILDTGFERQHVALRGRIVGAQFDFINGDTVVANQPGDPVGADQEQHGTWVWSLIGGFNPGQIVGPASNGRFFLAKVDAEPGDTRADEDRWVAAARWADSVGARIINSSVYFRSDFTDRDTIQFQELNGDVTATTVAADEAARRGILVVQAIGDAIRADGSLAAPADADSVLSVGAVNLNGTPIDLGGVASSARGPTADGRIKPEVVAVGANLYGANSMNQVGLTPLLPGTSFSTALMAGAAALFMEAWPGLTGNAVWRALLEAGDNGDSPDYLVGWGQPNLGAAIMMPEGLSTAAITPRDLRGNPTSLAPVFSWDAPQVYPDPLQKLKPINFRLELATDRLFEHVVAWDTVHEAFSLALRSPLQPGQVFWWRVTAESRNGIRRQSRVAGPITAPHWVELVSLAGDAPTSTGTTRPDLIWTALPAPAPVGPLTYDVEVLRHDNGEVIQRRTNLTGACLPAAPCTTRVQSPLTPNRPAYRWRVIAHTPQGRVDTVTSVHPFWVNSPDAPPATILYQNFPNPFPNFEAGATGTRIWFDLATTATVELTVHDLRGRLVRRLIPADAQSCSIVLLPPGIYGRPGSAVDDNPCILTTWDGRDQNGERLPRGVYVLRLLWNGKPEYRRMLYQPN